MTAFWCLAYGWGTVGRVEEDGFTYWWDKDPINEDWMGFGSIIVVKPWQMIR